MIVIYFEYNIYTILYKGGVGDNVMNNLENVVVDFKQLASRTDEYAN